jgi:hypothetical protein
MVTPLTPKPILKAETLTRATTTMVFCHEENDAEDSLSVKTWGKKVKTLLKLLRTNLTNWPAS